MASPEEKAASPEEPSHSTASAAAAGERTGLGSTGGPAPPKGPPVFPERPLRPPGLAGGKETSERLLRPPYTADVAPEGELLKSDIAGLGSTGVIERVIASAAKQAAVAAATTMHADDPTAAAMAASDAMEALFTKRLLTADTPGSKSTDSGAFENKLARDAILAGITDGRSSGTEKGKDDRVHKDAKLLPPFPGITCRTNPEAWEDWWEDVFGIQKC